LLRVLFLASKFSCFDASVALARDVDREGGLLKSIADGIGNDRIGDDF
jgi:hypothetical protein